MLPGPGTEPAVRPGRSATCLMRKRADAWACRLRRLRAGRYRVFYTIDEERRAVQIDHIARLP